MPERSRAGRPFRGAQLAHPPREMIRGRHAATRQDGERFAIAGKRARFSESSRSRSVRQRSPMLTSGWTRQVPRRCWQEREEGPEGIIGTHRLGQPRAKIHTSCAVVSAPTLDRAFARWCFTVECQRPRRWAAAFSEPARTTAATTPTSRSVARSAAARSAWVRSLMQSGPPRRATHRGPRSGSRRLLTRARHLSGAPLHPFRVARARTRGRRPPGSAGHRRSWGQRP